jgi:hypothetical protein
MTTISGQGLVDDGSANLTVQGATVTNVSYMTPNVLPGTGSVGAPAVAGFAGICPIPTPGFFQVPVSGSNSPGNAGQGGFTGSLPAASAFPGGEILVTDTVGRWAYLITGSISVMTGLTGSGGTTNLANAVSVNGTRLTVSPGGTVGFWSDSKGWLVCAVSGTLVLNQ